MSMEQYAARELDLIGMAADGDEMNAAMRKHILHMVREFADEGHSGFSASYALSCLKKLLAYEPLSPLTGADDEWNEVASGVFQNNRCGRVFKQADRFNGQAYDIDGRVFRDPDGLCYTNGDSFVPVTFPYTPTTEVVERGAA